MAGGNFVGKTIPLNYRDEKNDNTVGLIGGSDDDDVAGTGKQ